MDTNSTTRKNLRNLSDPMEMRELNRQLEWIWRQLLGGLTLKALSPETTKKILESSISEDVVNTLIADKIEANQIIVKDLIAENIRANYIEVQKLVADEIFANNATIGHLVAKEIDAESIETKTLKAVLAEMMVAEIGVAKIDYAQIVDMYANRIFTDVGLAGKFRMDKLEVTQAQIVDLIVNSFRLVSEDGKVYKIGIDQNGDLYTEFLEDQDTWFQNGKIPDGYSALASTLTVGEVTAGNLYVSGAADVMKLTAKYLVADTAWVNELTTTLIQGALGSKLTIKSDLGVDVLVTDVLKGIQSSIEMHSDSIELMAGRTTELEEKGTSQIFRQEEFPTSRDGVRINDIVVTPEQGLIYQAIDISEKQIGFFIGSDGALYYQIEDDSGDYGVEMQGFDLYAKGFSISVGENDEIDEIYEWKLVRDLELQKEIDERAEGIAAAIEKINGSIEELQSQVDGNVTSWFYWYVPTANNIPASEWTTDELKNAHLGDLFYVDNEDIEENGYCYRWQLSDGVYSWKIITDAGVVKALAAAKDAQETADGKMRVFVAEPIPPYDIGDIWVQGSSGDILFCNIAKTKGQTFSYFDWNTASKYTDDSYAKNVESALGNLRVDVEKGAIYDSATPPLTTPEVGKLWMDRSLTPPLLRIWKGPGSDTGNMDNWEVVSDASTIKKAQEDIRKKQAALEAAQNNVATFLKLDFDTVRIGKKTVTSEVQVDPWGMGVAVKGEVFSRFEADGTRFGNMELRLPKSYGGLVLDAFEAPK